MGVLAGGNTAAAPADSHIDLVSDTEGPPGPAADGRSHSASAQSVRIQADANGNSSAPMQRNNQGVGLKMIIPLRNLRAAAFAAALFSMLEQPRVMHSASVCLSGVRMPENTSAAGLYLNVSGCAGLPRRFAAAGQAGHRAWPGQEQDLA